VGTDDSGSPVFSIKHLSERIRTGDISPTELVESALDRINKLNPFLNAFITIIEEDELYRQAQTAEKEISIGKYRGPLHGIPFSIKDIIYINGTRCTAGSKILADYVPKSTATVVQRLKRAGGILIGTNNLNEFASGITGINPFYGTSKNPWDNSRLSGGSSGGSAVGVSTGMVLFSIGTDTGGSIRVPAALCGAVGLKPTYGRISMKNIFPLAPTLDHVGFITRSVWDAAAVMEYVAGQDASDRSSINSNLPPYTRIMEELCSKGLRIAVLKEYFFDNLHSEIADLFYKFVEFLHSIDIEVIDSLRLQHTGKFYSSWKNIRLAEAANVHLRWLNTRADDYSSEVKEMLMEGKEISAVDYIQSLKAASEIKSEILATMSNNGIDAIVVPTTIVAAPKISDSIVNVGNNVVVETRRALLQNTIVFNSTGLPAISIPIGLTKENMPVGVQIIGPPFREEIILSIANISEKLFPPMKEFEQRRLNLLNL
jgi:aspartyl-tRNA(Asn)/glutamyl-tRNA(Gln) amidotransferase subunit A